jgi:hypothetical protein
VMGEAESLQQSRPLGPEDFRTDAYDGQGETSP